MANSGSLYAHDIINAAYSFLGIYDETSTLTPFETQLGLYSLIDLLDSWDNQDLLVYSTTPYTFPFQTGVQTYQVGSINPFTCNILGNVMTVTSGTPGSVSIGEVLIAPGVAPNTTITGINTGNTYTLSWTAPLPITGVSAGLCSFVPPATNTFDVPSAINYNWNMPRPTKIERVTIKFPGGTNQPVELEIPIVDLDFWINLPQKNTQSLWPLYVYDDGADKFRNLNFYPVPSTNATCELYVYEQLNTIQNLNDTIFAPPGYSMALKLSLAEILELHFERILTPAFHAKALAARNSINNINQGIPSIQYDSTWGGSSGNSAVLASRGRVRI